ncbi:NADH-quinone oxidoreductase subunit N, partial [Francisella tularensis subsp. holarctica]|uniref:proton-conducting transporter transmembrane domain-containing protein n=1 Tax=Francisella tularensis TaxID=263 RepID=UPI002381B10E
INLFRIIGIMSIFFGSLVALSQNNVKRHLGYSTVSQIRFEILSTKINHQAYQLTSTSFYLKLYLNTTLDVYCVNTTIT